MEFDVDVRALLLCGVPADLEIGFDVKVDGVFRSLCLLKYGTREEYDVAYDMVSKGFRGMLCARGWGEEAKGEFELRCGSEMKFLHFEKKEVLDV